MYNHCRVYNYIYFAFFIVAILRGDLPPSYLVYSTGDGGYPSAGGLADRLRGITTIFYLAVLLGE